ncbi:hypothetical protein [Fictibacillus sp. 26RED30]|uniref:hypothetical protein n=1 Tax=Fictibacillus sp. 26RED30 TaxID=2745877 RepID=UPI0018CE81A5|nr:hypothetical protein [Fictibacillus sp. 26RED30]MBH0161800.1 hypothetical protein [Fictibacillus sp. 26RED30]
MNKWVGVLGSFALVSSLLIGCGSAEETSGSSDTKKEAKEAEQKEVSNNVKKDKDGNYILDTVGQKVETSGATAELLKIKEINETIEIAPIKVTINDVKVIKVTEVSNEFAVDVSLGSMVDSDVLEKGFSYVQVSFTAENTEEKNVEWYELMKVVTDKGEQVDAQMVDFLVDDSETDSVFYGKVKKEYKDGFIIKNDDINKVKFIFSSSMDADSYEDITPEQQVEYTFE